MQTYPQSLIQKSSGQKCPTLTVSSHADQVCTDGLKTGVGVSKGYGGQLAIDFDADHAARRTDPATSHAAARQAKTFASSHTGIILAALKLHGPMSPHELHITGLTVVQVDRRLPNLKAAGLARVVALDDGHPMTRNGARVWEAIA